MFENVPHFSGAGGQKPEKLSGRGVNTREDGGQGGYMNFSLFCRLNSAISR